MLASRTALVMGFDTLTGMTEPHAREPLATVKARADEVQAAARATRRAVNQLAELADDLRRDAVSRLRERGASEAQVARYEASLDDALLAVRGPLDALDRACAGLQIDADLLG